MKLYDVEVHREAGGVRIAISGEVDLSAIDDLEIALAPALGAQPSPVVVDLRDVSFLDSSGLRFLLALNERTSAGGGRFAIVAAGEPVTRVLELSGVEGRLEIVADPSDLG
jgi:anti-anti-sigma factor